MKLSLKGDRDLSPKSAFVKRPYPPGMHGAKKGSRRGKSEYGTQLLEKQKLKWTYGILERQFKRYFFQAQKERGVTAEALVEKLEQRLDNVVYRLGFAPSRPSARQMVTHGHINVNGRRVSIPSYSASIGDVIALRDASRPKGVARELGNRLKKYEAPKWLALDRERLEGKVIGRPLRDEAGIPSDIQKIVEFYSR